jgi:hypothetical protein
MDSYGSDMFRSRKLLTQSLLFIPFQNNKLLNWIDSHHMNLVTDYFCHTNDVDVNVYKPSQLLYSYIHWTFAASFTSVFLSFLFIYSAFNIVFGGLLMIAGDAEPNCIMMAGEPFGTTPHTRFSDAFALSWTTFTTVVSWCQIYVCS